MASPGRQRKALAKRLNVFLPEFKGHAVTWSAEKIYAAQGYYRSSPFNYNGSWRWEAYGFRDGDTAPWACIGSFVTMTELLRSKDWQFDGRELDCPTLPKVAGALIARAMARRRTRPEVDAKPGVRRPAAPTPAPPRRQP